MKKIYPRRGLRRIALQPGGKDVDFRSRF